jgi:hypothetical protein
MSLNFNAQQARNLARADLTIFNECSAIMNQIIQDAGNGLYQTIISDGTTMTESDPTPTADAQAFFSVWQGALSNTAKLDQMKQVLAYFERLGYTISRQTNTGTNTTFKWVIDY